MQRCAGKWGATAGHAGWIGSGRSGRANPTPSSACSLLRGGRPPGRTGSHGSQDTGSKPSWKKHSHWAAVRGQEVSWGVMGCPPSRCGSTAMAAGCPRCSWPFAHHLRAVLDLHGAHFVVGPAHGLQRGVVVADLPLAADEVVFLEEGDLGFLVVLGGKSRG